jgi:sugar (pentulose or hexulose) kinase
LPEVLNAGEEAGFLTKEGALLLDPTGETEYGAPMCPPEGDAGTGMVATNSVAVHMGNVSAGTSIFSMVVLEKPLSQVYPEVDMVTTPTGKPVAMIHCNNCTSDINVWVDMLNGFMSAMGHPSDKGSIYPVLFSAAMRGDSDSGGVVNCGYFSGEPITNVNEGRPILVRTADAILTFENLSRSLVFGAISTIAIGMEILKMECVQIDVLLGHGGFFKTPGTAQKLMAAALRVPISIMETAGEGGPWGIALLAAYRVHRAIGETLEEYLTNKVFGNAKRITETPDPDDEAGFTTYIERFKAILPAERAAVAGLK